MVLSSEAPPIYNCRLPPPACSLVVRSSICLMYGEPSLMFSNSNDKISNEDKLFFLLKLSKIRSISLYVSTSFVGLPFSARRLMTKSQNPRTASKSGLPLYLFAIDNASSTFAFGGNLYVADAGMT